MQIQRIQSVWLLCAFVCALVSLCFPWLVIAGKGYGVQDSITLLVLGLLATILPLLGIFMYKNLRRQKQVCALSALMAVLCLGFVVAWSFMGPDPESSVALLAPCLMAVSAIFDILARRGIIHDEKLLRAADRIR